MVSSAESRPTTGAWGENRTAVPSAPDDEATDSAGGPEKDGGGPAAELVSPPPHPCEQMQAHAAHTSRAERLRSNLTNGGPTGAPACHRPRRSTMRIIFSANTLSRRTGRG